MKDGIRIQAMKLLHEAFGNHAKQRCNEYLSLMYLMLLTGSSQEQVELGMSTLTPSFKQQIETINQTSRETARESNYTATAIATLFKAWQTAVEEADRKDMYNDHRVDHIQEFVARYQIQFEEDGYLKKVFSRELFVALKRVVRDFGLRFEMDSSKQFAQRFANDLETIRGAGFDVVISQKRYGTKLYTIQSVEP